MSKRAPKPPSAPPSSTDQAMQATMQALAGARLAGGPATAAERAATGVDTYLVDSEDEAETNTSAIDDFERRLAARQPPSGVAPVAPAQPKLPATNSMRDAPEVKR